MRVGELIFDYALRNFRHPVRRWRYARESRAPSAPPAPHSRDLSTLRLILSLRLPSSQWIFALQATPLVVAYVLVPRRMAARCGWMMADA